MVKISNLNFAYDKAQKRKIINSLNVNFIKNEISIIMGLSGCGKSTLLKIIAKEIVSNSKNCLSGNVVIDNEDINNIKEEKIITKLAIVRQDVDSQLIFPLVLNELAFGLENLCVPKKEMLERIDEITKKLCIDHLLFENPRFLSGGEKQLVVLASVLLLGADILLLDECMAQIDKKGREIILKTLRILRVFLAFSSL